MSRKLDARHFKLGLISGLVGLLGAALSYVAAIAFAVVTGVASSCSWAPDFIAAAFFFVLLLGVPLGGVLSARWCWKRFASRPFEADRPSL